MEDQIQQLVARGADREKILQALENDYKIEDIKNRYEENPRHLTFMAIELGEERTDYVLTKSDDSDIVAFAAQHSNEYDIDLSYLAGELQGGREDDSAAYMEFMRIVNEHCASEDETEYFRDSDDEMELFGDSSGSDTDY